MHLIFFFSNVFPCCVGYIVSKYVTKVCIFDDIFFDVFFQNLVSTTPGPLSQTEQTPLDNQPQTEIPLHNLDVNGHVQDTNVECEVSCMDSNNLLNYKQKFYFQWFHFNNHNNYMEYGFN